MHTLNSCSFKLVYRLRPFQTGFKNKRPAEGQTKLFN